MERLLPSTPIAVFNRATLHRTSDGGLILIGIGGTVPSAQLEGSKHPSPIIWADLQEDHRSPTLLAVGYANDCVAVFNAVNGKRLWVGSALGTASGVFVRDILVRSSRTRTNTHVLTDIRCWPANQLCLSCVGKLKDPSPRPIRFQTL